MSHINTESQNSHLQFYTISTAILWRDLEPPSIQKNHPALTSYYSLYIYICINDLDLVASTEPFKTKTLTANVCGDG